MTYRLLALKDQQAGDARLGASVAQRLEMLAELSRLAWEASGRDMPQYARATMPVRMTTLQELGAGTRSGTRKS